LKTHLQLALWALQILWGLKTIWFTDRLRLWKKSINLYMAFLAFTDSGRPTRQLRRAMICAFLSAVYDYDTDWTFGNRDGTNCTKLLNQYILSDEARELATKLFATETNQDLSEDGLERGSAALRFYWLVIDSDWMREYRPEQIDEFGRKLQIIDDLLDLENDRVAGDTNSLLLEDKAQAFVAEAEEFLESDFFGKLKRNSKVYKALETKTRGKLHNFRTRSVSLGQLIKTSRSTAGIYAGLLVYISFSFHQNIPLLVCVLTGLAFCGLTMSIMTFNDWVDREHDRKKGKTFASEHPKHLLRYWWSVNGVTGALLAVVAWYNIWTAFFCALVWLLGLLYSYIPHWYIVQNLVVAICAGSPALCGMIYFGKTTPSTIWTFLIFTVLLFVNEVYKDIEDQGVDPDYKETMPVHIGHTLTVVRLIGICFVVMVPFLLHPNPWMTKMVVVGIPLLQYQQAKLLVHPEQIARPKSTIRWMLKILLIVLLAT